MALTFSRSRALRWFVKELMKARQTVWHSYTVQSITNLKNQKKKKNFKVAPLRSLTIFICSSVSGKLFSSCPKLQDASRLFSSAQERIEQWIGQGWTPVVWLCVRLCAYDCVCKSHLLFIGWYLSINVFLGECVLECVLILSFWFPFSQMPTERSKSTQRNK